MPLDGLPDWLARSAQARPDRLALVADGRTWTFAELDADVARLARRLSGLGVRTGDRVATLLHNGAAPVMIVHAALRLGAVLVPLNTRLGHGELAWQIGDASPRLLIVDRRTRAVAELACRHSDVRPAIVDLDEALSAGEASVGLRLRHSPDDVLAVLYTSGTTGRPKGAMLTVGNFWWSAIGSALNLGTRGDDRWLACLPLFHVGGLSILLRSAIYGTAAVVHDGFDEHAVNRAIDADRITIISVVALTLQRMLDARDGRPYPPALRCVLLGGGPAPLALLERCASAGLPVVQTYGLTETCSQIATLDPGDAPRRMGSAGRPLYPNDIRILADDRASDGSGEILVRGPVVTPGYAGRPLDTARAIVNGWLHTGDVGRLDADGFLYVLDRRDDLIVSGGENVYPVEVENVLLTHPQVIEAGVVGVPDSHWGQRVVAVVRVRGGESPTVLAESLRAFCRERLAAYKTPRAFRIESEPLPRTASGKLKRADLRDLIAAS